MTFKGASTNENGGGEKCIASEGDKNDVPDNM
jgi:hypothetical protein